MARLPSNIVRRRSRYYFRAFIAGRDVRMSLGENLADAKRQAVLLQQKLRSRLVAPPPAGGDFGSFAKRWLTEYVGLRRNPDGRLLAQQRCEKHLLPVLGGLQLAEVSSTHLRMLRAILEEKELTPQTVRHVLADVRCLFRFAVEVGEVTDSPFRSSVMPKVPETAPRRLTDEEVDAVVAASPVECRPTLRLAVLTGLRWGELRRLQWRHVVWQPSPHLVLEGTKSGRVRRVPLVPGAEALVREQRAGTSSLFVLPWRPLKATRLCRAVEQETGIRWHVHQLRHTFACRWLDAGGSKEALQKILGHSTIKMTERYGRMSDEAVFAEAVVVGANSGRKVGTVDGTPRDSRISKTP